MRLGAARSGNGRPNDQPRLLPALTASDSHGAILANLVYTGLPKGHFYSDRTSCHEWWSNQFRLLLSSLAYVLVDTLRRVYLKGTRFALARCATIRLKLLKIGAVLVCNTRRVKFMLAEGYPYKDLFYTLHQKLCSS